MDFDKLKILLDDFQKVNIKSTSIEPTFMDISGFPHYENVCSNILKFFFLSEEAHGLKDLFLRALLKTVGEDVNHYITVDDVIREQTTNKGNRIDIVILTDEYVIGIENKIFASVYNDLHDYSSYLDGIGKGKKIYKVLLSIYSTKSNGSDFVNIRYSELFNAINGLIGNYWNGASQKYLTYLSDFMQTIMRIEGDLKMDNDLAKFLNDNLEETQKLLKAINEMKKNLRQRVQDLSIKINYDENKCKQWFWRDNNLLTDDLVHDINVDDAVVAIDTNDYPIGWTICIWLRKPGNSRLKNREELIEWLISKGIHKEDIIINDQNETVYSKKYSTSDDTAIHLQNLLDKLCS